MPKDSEAFQVREKQKGLKLYNLKSNSGVGRRPYPLPYISIAYLYIIWENDH